MYIRPFDLNHRSVSESFHRKASTPVALSPLSSYDRAEHALFLFGPISTSLLSFWTSSSTYSRDSSLLLLGASMSSSICQLHLSRYKYRDKQGCPPLHYSVRRGRGRGTRLLMDGGADVTAVDKLRIVASARSRHLMAKNFRVSVSSREILLSCNLHRSHCFT